MTSIAASVKGESWTKCNCFLCPNPVDGQFKMEGQQHLIRDQIRGPTAEALYDVAKMPVAFLLLKRRK